MFGKDSKTCYGNLLGKWKIIKTEVPMKNKRVLIWIYQLDQNLLKYLKEENVTVIAILGGASDDVPSFSIFDLFYRSATIPFNDHASRPIHLSDAFLYRYLDCISRVSFVPMTEECCYVDIGIVGADNVADWVQFHAQTILQLLQYYAPDEIWLFQKPHLGLDNLLVEVGRQLGLPVITFYQIAAPGKFIYEMNYDRSTKLELEFASCRNGAFKPNLFYMAQYDTMPTLERFVDRSSFYMKAPFKALLKGQRKQTINRVYLAGQKREWALLLLLMDCLCGRTRPIAFYRFSRRLRFRAALKKRALCHQVDLEKPFIYFALHYQPEASTSAQGGFFANQMNAIEAMREILPAGWWIYVKENPKQRYMFRDLPFYLRARQWPDVRFIDDSAQSEDMIKISRIVATVTGTVGYEALLLGKPCVYFGEAWYEGLPNAFRFNDKLNLVEISLFKGDIQELGKAVDAKMATAADGVVFPMSRALLAKDSDWPKMMRTTAKSLVRISDAAGSISDKGNIQT